jgi:hypothetical protein
VKSNWAREAFEIEDWLSADFEGDDFSIGYIFFCLLMYQAATIVSKLNTSNLFKLSSSFN